jgi:eukaryotic-like serine/threonine-protein kinase
MGAILNKCPKCQKVIPMNRLGTITALIFPLSECRCQPDKTTRKNSRTRSLSVERSGDGSFIGKVIDDRYQIISHIGSGGMGSVYLAVDQNTNTEYALKFIASGLAEQEHLVKRLEHEARAAKSLSHAHIVPVYDVGKDSGSSPYLIMGYVTGESLEDVLNSEGSLKSNRATNVFIQIAEALAHAHEKGIVHRDLKPSNILLTKKENVEDFVKIVDFGIAKIADEYNADKTKLTQTGELVGSPLYMSPEQCRGDC